MQVAKQVETISQKIKTYSAQQTITKLMNLLPRASNSALIKTTYLLERLARNETKKQTIRIVREAFEDNHPVTELSRRLLRDLHPNCKRGFIATFIVQAILADASRRKEYELKYEEKPPHTVLISPTMGCNIRCVGCYAYNYTRKADMSPDLFHRIINESKEIGVSFITVVGGEPFVYEPLLDIFEAHRDMVFQVYTNGTLLNRETVKKIVKLGNVAPVISLEGFKKETDSRRGEGVFDHLMKVMNYLREEGTLFLYSVCATRLNYEAICSDEFFDLMIEKGAAMGWYFNYMPVGRKPDLDLMPTPEQRNYIRSRINEVRTKKPILLIDFWGDGPLVEGCLAGGNIYMHINNKGDVEPCIFAHYSVDNIKEKSITEVLQSDFFKAIRRTQPFGNNDIRPCPLIDFPGAMGSLVRRYGAKPTHEGAEELISDLVPELRKYSKELAGIYNKVWEEEYSWVKKWKNGGCPSEDCQSNELT